MGEAILETLSTPIRGVLANDVVKSWPRVEPILKRVVTPQTGYTLDHVLTELQLKQAQLWVIGDYQAVVITKIVVRPLHSVLWVHFIAGSKMHEWLEDWITVQEEFAQYHNCAAVEFSGRGGWRKIGEKHPTYKPVLTTFRKDLV